MENNQFKVPEANLGWLKEKLEKLNRRAVKLSMPLIELSILGEEMVLDGCKNETCIVAPPCTCEKTYHKVLTVEIKGQAPSIDGWDFIGTIEHTEGGNILRLLPGQTIPESYRQADNQNCDHCHTKRNRTSTYILVNAKNEHKQVGKQCLQDFFKQDVSNVVARAELLAIVGQLGEASDNERIGGGSGRQYYKLDDYLANVIAVVEKHGFVSRAKANETEQTPTSTLATVLMTKPMDKDALDLQVKVTKEHEAKATEIITWIENYLEKPNLSDYEHNLKVVVDSGYCEWKTFGLAASITALHYRETAAKAEKEAKKPSEYVGEVGKRMKGLTLTLVKITNLGEGAFGMRYLYRFLDVNDNVFVWFTGNLLDADTREFFENTVYNGDASVKEHSEYKGTKQTVLTRCKLFSPVLRAKFDAKEEVR